MNLEAIEDLFEVNPKKDGPLFVLSLISALKTEKREPKDANEVASDGAANSKTEPQSRIKWLVKNKHLRRLIWWVIRYLTRKAVFVLLMR